MIRWRTSPLAVIALLAAVACSDRAASSAVSELSGDPAGEEPGSASDEAIPAGATLAEILELKGKKYAAGYIAEDPLIQGTLAQGARSDHLVVLRAGHCYRIVAAGGDGVSDLDLFLYDPAGVQTHQDPGEDRYPALGMQTEICPFDGGAYRLQVHMYKGEGPFAARVYRTPP